MTKKAITFVMFGLKTDLTNISYIILNKEPFDAFEFETYDAKVVFRNNCFTIDDAKFFVEMSNNFIISN